MKKTYNNIDYYLLAANYTGWYLTKHNVPEQRLNYLTEDVGLNYFYFLYNHNFPPFMLSNSLSFPQIRGEFYFFLHKQLLNRYVTLPNRRIRYFYRQFQFSCKYKKIIFSCKKHNIQRHLRIKIHLVDITLRDLVTTWVRLVM